MGLPAAARKRPRARPSVPQGRPEQFITVIEIIELPARIELGMFFGAFLGHGLHQGIVPRDTDEQVAAAQEGQYLPQQFHTGDATAFDLLVEHVPDLFVHLAVILGDEIDRVSQLAVFGKEIQPFQTVTGIICAGVEQTAAFIQDDVGLSLELRASDGKVMEVQGKTPETINIAELFCLCVYVQIGLGGQFIVRCIDELAEPFRMPAFLEIIHVYLKICYHVPAAFQLLVDETGHEEGFAAAWAA